MSSLRPDLIIIRHANPDVRPDRPAASWPLSPAGQAAATDLGERLRRCGDLRLVASNELKAIQTGEAIARGTPVAIDDRFGEQGLGSVPFLPGAAFRERVIAHFEQPDARILGNESSRGAGVRFTFALKDHIGERSGDMIPTIVSHGRIISAWLTALARPASGEMLAPTDLWESLRMPEAFLLQRDPDDPDRWIWKRFDPVGGL